MKPVSAVATATEMPDTRGNRIVTSQPLATRPSPSNHVQPKRITTRSTRAAPRSHSEHHYFRSRARRANLTRLRMERPSTSHPFVQLTPSLLQRSSLLSPTLPSTLDRPELLLWNMKTQEMSDLLPAPADCQAHNIVKREQHQVKGLCCGCCSLYRSRSLSAQ